jgi:S-adenosylmethionine synthetase
MMFGNACRETTSLMPLPIVLAHDLTRLLASTRKNGDIKYLRPDGKSQVTVEYDGERPVRVDTVVISTQHDPDVPLDVIRREVTEGIIDQVIPKGLRDKNLRVFVNPTGRFVTGGPRRRRADRAQDHRRNLRREPVFVETFGTNKIDEALLADLVRKHFDLRPAAIIHNLNLRRPIYQQTAAYGHFGRPDLDLPWEKTDKAEALRSAAGLKGAVDRELAPLTA